MFTFLKYRNATNLLIYFGTFKCMFYFTRQAKWVESKNRFSPSAANKQTQACALSQFAKSHVNQTRRTDAHFPRHVMGLTLMSRLAPAARGCKTMESSSHDCCLAKLTNTCVDRNQRVGPEPRWPRQHEAGVFWVRDDSRCGV